MGEHKMDKPNGTPTIAVDPVKVTAYVMIALLADGSLKVDHPPDEILTRGLLDLGRDGIRDHFKARREGASQIVTPPPGLRLL